MHKDTIPWHKQPLVWMIISIPMAAVVMGIIIIYLAVTTDDGLVAEDYYKQGLTINRLLVKEKTASTLQLSASVDINADTGFIQVAFNKGGMKGFPAQIQMALRHATKQQLDIFLILQKGINNQYVGYAPRGVNHGVWHIELSNTIDEKLIQWRMGKRVKLENVTAISMRAG